MADAPNVVWVPIFFPLGGVGWSPQEMTATTYQGSEKKRKDIVGKRKKKKDSRKVIEWGNQREGKKEEVVSVYTGERCHLHPSSWPNGIKEWPVLFHGEYDGGVCLCSKISHHAGSHHRLIPFSFAFKNVVSITAYKRFQTIKNISLKLRLENMSTRVQ